MWKLQGGSYIPGFSSQAFGAGLTRDVIKTQEDQAKKARELNKYMSKRGAMGKWGGKIASGLLGVGLGAMGMGPLGLLAAKSIGAGLGSAFGSSEMLSGKGPSMQPGAGTGLLGSGYERLGEAKGGIGEAMRGQALGAGAAQAVSGMTGMAGDKLGAAFGKTGLGMNLKSGYGKMMAEKFGKNIGQALPEAEQITDLKGTGLARGFDYGESPLNKLFDPSQFGQSQFDPSLLSDAMSPISSGQYGPLQDSYFQQGGYMQGYQQGGMMPGGVSNALPYQQGGEAERKTLYDVGRDKDEGIVDYDDDFYNYKRILSIPADQVGEGEGLRYYAGEGISDRLQSSKDQAGFDARQKMAFAPQDSIQFDMIRDYLKPERKGLMKMLGFQEGGSISPYNLGGSVTQQPMAYQLGGLLKYKRSPMMG